MTEEQLKRAAEIQYELQKAERACHLIGLGDISGILTFLRDYGCNAFDQDDYPHGRIAGDIQRVIMPYAQRHRARLKEEAEKL